MLEKLGVVAVDYRTIHLEIVENKTQDTGESFKLKEEVQKWMEEGNTVMWVTGGRECDRRFSKSVNIS